MILFPAIDLKEGRCVRLIQGDMDQATVFNDDPAEQAATFESQGFEWVHIVDLDGAFAGKPVNADVVRTIVARIRIPIQLGGGIRDMKTVEGWLQAGIKRVIIGTAAVKNPGFLQDACYAFSGHIIAGLDAKESFSRDIPFNRMLVKLKKELIPLGFTEIVPHRHTGPRLDPEQLRGDSGVEQVGRAPPVVLMQQAQIVVGVVEHDLDLGIGEQGAERRRRLDRERIDDAVMRARRELDQVDPIDEAMEARPFGVDRQFARVPDRLEETRDARV
mgnify:CR=1 FL=1